MNLRQLFLKRLEKDGQDRPMFVERLRHGAELLEDRLDFDIDGPMSGVKVAHTIARELRDKAQRLCDHARVSGDGRYRYCETLITEPEA